METYASHAQHWNGSAAPTWTDACRSILRYFFQDIVCSPVRFARVLWRMAANISMQFRVFQLLKNGVLARFVCSNPSFLFKYLSPSYLVRDLPAPTRTACYLHHYQRLQSCLSESLLRRILQQDLAVFQMREDDHLFEIAIGRSRHIANSRHVDHEGELSLHLLVDGAYVYVLSFTIVPGWVVGSHAAEVLMITRLQGGLGVFPQISLASKAMHGMPPEMILINTLHGVSEALGIRAIAGVSAIHHLCYSVEDDTVFKRSYDEFFVRIGADRNDAGFFTGSFPLAEKPLSMVKRGQKTRARARRGFKALVATETFEFFRMHKSAAVDSPAFSVEAQEDSRDALTPEAEPALQESVA